MIYCRTGARKGFNALQRGKGVVRLGWNAISPHDFLHIVFSVATTFGFSAA
jgi:hypothetical protein